MSSSIEASLLVPLCLPYVHAKKYPSTAGKAVITTKPQANRKLKVTVMLYKILSEEDYQKNLEFNKFFNFGD